MESNNVIEQEQAPSNGDISLEDEYPLKEGEYQYPNISVKRFKSTKALGDWLTLIRPNIISLQTQRDQDGSLVYELKIQRENTNL